MNAPTSKTNVEIIRELLASATDPEVVNRLVAPDATYLSLTFDNPDLKKIMPWAGTHQGAGPAAVLETFQVLNTFWTIESFDIRDIFESGENVAVFGSFTVHSVILDKTFVSPFSVHARVKEGLVTYMQYMEDTFGTGATFRSGGTWKFHSNPKGGEIEI
jgi:uncharacterized protein